MAHTWKYALGLGFIGAALSVACTVTTGDDSGSAGESASGGTGGSTGGTGGSGGTTGGSSGTGGSTGGTGGTTGTGGSTSGTGGSTSGSGGSGAADTSPTCDGDKMGTPYPNCDPGDGEKDDACALCIQKSCCEESMNCYATDPYNVCGWGGPSTDDPEHAVYTGAGEIGCIKRCLSDYVTENEVCDTDGIDDCTSRCQTEMCSLVGSATSELFTCMQDSCAKDCFGADTCN